jgi:hypothetical protein
MAYTIEPGTDAVRTWMTDGTMVCKQVPAFRAHKHFNRSSEWVAGIGGKLIGSVWRPTGRKWAVVFDAKGEQIAHTLGAENGLAVLLEREVA